MPSKKKIRRKENKENKVKNDFLKKNIQPVLSSILTTDEDRTTLMLQNLMMFDEKTYKNEAFVNFIHPQAGASMLSFACMKNMPRLAQILINSGANVNLKTEVSQTSNRGRCRGATPFWEACYRGSLECVQLLSKVPGIDMNARHFKGSTPFFTACTRAQHKIVRHLLSLEDGLIDYNACCIGDECALSLAIANRHISVTKILLADPRIQRKGWANTEGYNLMDMACYAGSVRLLKLLEAHGCDPPNNPEEAFKDGWGKYINSILTDRRALAEDYVREKYSCTLTCSYCQAIGSQDPTNGGRCAQCLRVWYCSQKCQRRDWKKSHKSICQQIVVADNQQQKP